VEDSLTADNNVVKVKGLDLADVFKDGHVREQAGI
jgi:hypothetical protein